MEAGMEVEFSNHLDGNCFLSPNGKLMAQLAHPERSHDQVVVLDTHSLEILSSCPVKADAYGIKWSYDSTRILWINPAKNNVQLRSLLDWEWKGEISCGKIPVGSAQWTPDGMYILTTDHLKQKSTLWSLADEEPKAIQSPKGERFMRFSPDNKYLAVVERYEYIDNLSIFTTNPWELKARFPLDFDNLEGVAWSPNSKTVAVWESHLNYRIDFYSLNGIRLGQHLGQFGELGIRTMQWSNSSRMLAIGSYEDGLEIMNGLTFRPIGRFQFADSITDTEITIYDETFDEEGDECTRTSFTTRKAPFEISCVLQPDDKPNPKIGCSVVQWSHDDRFIMAKQDNLPCCLFVIEPITQKIDSMIQHQSPVRRAQWSPSATILAYCTSLPKVYIWTPEKTAVIDIPLDDFVPKTLQWNAQGTCIVLNGESSSFCCYLCE